MRKTIRAWSATSVSTVGAAASMAIADFRTVSPKIACPAILCLRCNEGQPENGKCSDILRLFSWPQVDRSFSTAYRWFNLARAGAACEVDYTKKGARH